MDCEHRVLDVFVTNADPNLEDDYDDQFVCAVQSVRLHVESEDTYAVIVEEETDWVTVTFPSDHAASDPFKTISKGDLIRVGGPSTGGFTDYLTVVEKVPIKAYRNATASKISMRSDGHIWAGITDEATGFYTRHHETWLRPYGTAAGNTSVVIGYNLTDGDITSTLMDVDEYVAAVRLPDGFNASVSIPGVQQYALRLNHSINATTINEIVEVDRSKRLVAGNHRYGKPESLTNNATLEQRHLLGFHLYPMYHMKQWRTGQSLTAELDHGVKQVEEVRLMGYSLINKRNVGPQHAHEMIQDDYLILRIKEVEGRVISNNRHANGAFAILYAGSNADNTKGGVDVHRYDTDGIVRQRVDATNSVMRNLTVELLDRTGQPAHFGRLHLWFKILASHG